MTVYTPASYHRMVVGEHLRDNFLGRVWEVKRNIENGAYLREVTNYDCPATLEVTPECVNMYFRTVA